MGNISQPPFMPAPFTLESPDVTVLTGTALTAGRAFFTALPPLYASVIVAQMRCFVSSASPTGNIDMGIYDATGTNNAPNNLLGHTGAIAATTGLFTKNLTGANNAPNNLLGHTGAIAAATGVFTKSLIANTTIPPGLYWLAIVDTVADSIGMRSGVTASIGANVQTSSASLTVLPNPAGAVTNSILRAGLEALLSGSWS